MKDGVMLIAVLVLVLLCICMAGITAVFAPTNSFSTVTVDVFPISDQSSYPNPQKILVAPDHTPAP